MEKKYILVIDEGTTSVRSVIFDRQMQIVADTSHRFDMVGVIMCYQHLVYLSKT